MTDALCSLTAYGDKMVNDRFDGSVGFSIDLGIKDSLSVSIVLISLGFLS